MAKEFTGPQIKMLRFQLSIIRAQEMTSLLFVFTNSLTKKLDFDQTLMYSSVIEMGKTEHGIGRSYLMRLTCLVKHVLLWEPLNDQELT